MNKVEKVSIGGYAFSLEEDAFKAISEYLDALSGQYAGSEDKDEIIEAFEDRIAELLLEKNAQGSTVTLEDIKSIEERLGMPENTSDAPEKSVETVTAELKKDRKYFFRSRQDKLLGGVCGGLAAYYNMDVFLMRLIWVVAFILGATAGDSHYEWLEWLGFLAPVTIVAYLLLWIRTPFADGKHERMMETRRFSSRENVSTAGKVIGNVLRITIGVIMPMTGIAGIVAGALLIAGWSMNGSILPPEMIESITEICNGAIFRMPAALTITLCCLVYFLPFLILLYEGIKVSFNFNSPSWHPGIIAILVWFVVLLFLTVVAGLSFIPSINI